MSDSSPTIALDAMGGDHGPHVVIAAALKCLDDYPQLVLTLVGDERVLLEQLKEASTVTSDRLRIHHASEKVAMDESPAKALRNKKDSSMRVAINQVKEGAADACVSAGNTGALMATARFVLKMIPGIDRPAIIALMPSIRGHTYVLDMGANIDSSAEHLLQFAVMGNELVRAVDKIDSPTIGLLNVGEEEIKGNEQVKQAAKLIADSHLNFVGFVEGNHISTGNTDLIVTDGFVGNISLKTTEGVAQMIVQGLKDSFRANWYSKLAGLIAMPCLKAFKQRFDPRQNNGATLIGLRGIVVKSHGGADSESFANAIRMALEEIEYNIPDKIGQRVASVLSERDPG